MSNDNDARTVAHAYLEAFSRKDFDAFRRLLADDITFTGPTGKLSGAEAISTAYQRLAGMLVRNELRKTFVDKDEVCIIYDFVSDTAAGAVPTVEWLKVEHGKIRSIWLVTDHVRWPAALAELAQRGR
jgi:ketosteroid isomerase-like protein